MLLFLALFLILQISRLIFNAFEPDHSRFDGRRRGEMSNFTFILQVIFTLIILASMYYLNKGKAVSLSEFDVKKYLVILTPIVVLAILPMIRFGPLRRGVPLDKILVHLLGIAGILIPITIIGLMIYFMVQQSHEMDMLELETKAYLEDE